MHAHGGLRLNPGRLGPARGFQFPLATTHTIGPLGNLMDNPTVVTGVTENPFLARSRSLAKMALASAAALVALVLLLPLLIDHATVSEGFIIVWGVFLLLAAIILGVSLAYVFMTRGVRMGEEASTPSDAGRVNPELAVSPPRSPEGLHDEQPVTELALRLLTEDERRIYRRIVEAGGALLQKDLVGAKVFSGPKITRILDRLERKGLIARERYGMTNRIRLSDTWRERA